MDALISVLWCLTVVPLPLPTVQNGDKTVLEIKVHAANEKAQCAFTRGPDFFSFGVGGGRGLSPVSDIKVHTANEKAQDALMRGPTFLLCGGPGVFLFLFFCCSQHVPKLFPSSTSVLSHIVCTKFNSQCPCIKNWKDGPQGKHIYFYFETWGSKDVLLLGSA
jgi:hypothetical protein